MSQCRKCGKELICDVPHTIKLEDTEIHGFVSRPHGCPPEFDHFQCDATQVWSEETIEGVFEAVEQAGGTLIDGGEVQ